MMYIDENESNDEYEDARALTAKKNLATMKWLVKDWSLGPIIGIDNNQGNNSYWKRIAAVWGITTKEARRRSCANCEYGNIEPAALEAMEHIPYNKYDKDGCGRVWCDKYDFICHSVRVCQAWEED